MKTYELHLTPKRFDPVYTGRNSSIYTDLDMQVVIGCHIVAQEFERGTFTGRWVRLQATYVERTTEHKQIISVRVLARSTEKVVGRRAA